MTIILVLMMHLFMIEKICILNTFVSKFILSLLSKLWVVLNEQCLNILHSLLFKLIFCMTNIKKVILKLWSHSFPATPSHELKSILHIQGGKATAGYWKVLKRKESEKQNGSPSNTKLKRLKGNYLKYSIKFNIS